MLQPETIRRFFQVLLLLLLLLLHYLLSPALAGMARAQFGLELEDVISLHIMEDPYPDMLGFQAGDFSREVLQLVNSPGEELYASDDAGSLRTTGYALNGAFSMAIDSASQRASLVPSRALSMLCPAGRVALSGTDPFPNLCYLRRDVRGRNWYPVRPASQVLRALAPTHHDAHWQPSSLAVPSADS